MKRRYFLIGGIAVLAGLANPYDIFARNIPPYSPVYPPPIIKPVNENYRLIGEIFANRDKIRYNKRPDVVKVDFKENKDYFVDRAIFWLNRQEMAGFSFFTPKIQSGDLEEFIRKRCAGAYTIVNRSDKEMGFLPTVRGGYDGVPIIPFIEESAGNSKDKEFDGRLQGIVRRNAVSGNPEEIIEEWKKMTADEIAGAIEALADQLVHRFTTKEEVLKAENSDYLNVLRKMNEIFLLN